MTIESRPLRVSFYTPMLQMGGAERWIFSLARHFRCLQPDVLFYANHFQIDDATYAEASSLFNRLEPIDVKSPDVEKHRDSARASAAVVMWGWAPFPDVNKPIIYVSHSADAMRSDHNLEFADFVAAVSLTAVDALQESRRDECEVIYNGIEFDRITPRFGRQAVRHAWNIGDKKLILYFGRFHPVKQCKDVLSALRYLPDEYVAMFVGEGHESESIVKKAERIAPDRVLMCSSSAHVGDFLAGADIVVLPSNSEACPLVALETW